jgi:peptidoglycan/xylan/chitin deacetylase (PgdA/CDA1 family)
VHPPIIYFHSVAPHKNELWARSYLTLELKYFIEVLEFIKFKKLNTIFIKDIGKPSLNPKKDICISFDDGYLDNWVYVFPILKKYGFKATIFTSVDYCDKRDVVRPNTEDIENGSVSYDEIQDLGFLSIPEMLLMERSGLVDIQSHTVTHDKIFCSTKLKGFHSPVNKNINFILSENPLDKPFYITNKNFLAKSKYGHPIFEEKSAIIQRKFNFNTDFFMDVIELYSSEVLQSGLNHVFYSKAEIILKDYLKKNHLILSVESIEDYRNRVKHEIVGSKHFFEKKLNKKIEVLCWPHGDFNSYAIDVAREVGYHWIHYVKGKDESVKKQDYMFERFGIKSILNSTFFSRVNFSFDYYDQLKVFPFNQIKRIYRKLK